MRKVRESYKARNNKNRNPEEDQQEFWEEGSGKIQIGINKFPDFRAVPPKGMTDETMAKLGQFAGRNPRMAMGALIVYAGGKKSKSAAPKSELERTAERGLQ
eukprot:2845725-Pyramimonas_sp.AAC.1